MKIYQLFHALIEKFVPMDKSTQDQLQIEAVNYYGKILDEARYIDLENEEINATNKQMSNDVTYEPKPLKKHALKHKAIMFLDQWYMRYIFAILFIYLVPKIKAFINGETSTEQDEDEDENPQHEYQQFLEFQRFKKSMI
jgi:hypothetical protein